MSYALSTCELSIKKSNNNDTNNWNYSNDDDPILLGTNTTLISKLSFKILKLITLD